MNEQIVGTLQAYVHTRYSTVDPAALHSVRQENQEQKDAVISALTLSNSGWIKEDGEYIPVGSVEVTLKLLNVDDMVQGQIESLKAERKKTQAEAERAINAIDEKISKLQAITYTPDAV